jgi:hypothetical protein
MLRRDCHRHEKARPEGAGCYWPSLTSLTLPLAFTLAFRLALC